MMLRISLFLVLGTLPLAAQSRLQNGDKLDPDQTPQVVPQLAPGPATMQPSVNPPLPGAPPVPPEMPAEPIILPKIAEFTVQPGTVREIMLSKYQLLTTIKLTVPATKDMLFHVASSDLIKVVATDIKFIKGQQESFGGLQVNWNNIKRDSKVEFEAYDAEYPDVTFHGRLYIKKIDKGPAPTP